MNGCESKVKEIRGGSCVRLQGDPSLRLKNGYVQDDAARRNGTRRLARPGLFRGLRFRLEGEARAKLELARCVDVVGDGAEWRSAARRQR